MTIKPFTMDEVDEEIQQIVQQQETGQTGASGPPNIIKSFIDRAKSLRTGKNGITENSKL